jgi:hypothetical protein
MHTTQELSQSLGIGNIVPQFIQENYPSFVGFLEAYYDWMEQNGNVNNILHKFGMLNESVDYFADRTSPADSQFDSFAKDLYELYSQEYAKSYPVEKVLREDLFIKSIREVLACKGSVDSIKNFFRTIYGEEVEVEFPSSRRETFYAKTYYKIKTHILLSEGFVEQKLAVLNACIGRYFRSTFGTVAQLQKISSQEITGKLILELEFINLTGGYFVSGDKVSYQFTPEEIIFFSSPNLNLDYGNQTQNFYYVDSTLSFHTNGIVTEYEIQQSGTGYRIGETIILTTGNEIQSGVAVITSVNTNGGITGIQITNNGYGFNAYLKIDDRAQPDYSDLLYGGRIYSSGSGAILWFKAGAVSFWDASKTLNNGAQTLAYESNNSEISGSGSFGEYFEERSSTDPTDFFGYFVEQEEGTEGGYYNSVVNSQNPAEYSLVLARSSDSKTFGRIYFETQFIDDSTNHGTTNFDFNSKFNTDSQYTVGIITSESTAPNINVQLGTFVGSWGVQILNGFVKFFDQGVSTLITSSIPSLGGTKTIRFLLDLVDNVCYVGNANGWYSGKTNTLTSLPEIPVFDDIEHSSGIRVGSSGRFIPQINLRFASRVSQMVYDIPENFATQQQVSSEQFSPFSYDFDPFKIPVLPWDTSPATEVDDADVYKLTSEEVVYRYKIKTAISPRVWDKIYRACVHPVGTQYEAQIVASSSSLDSVIGSIVSLVEEYVGQTFIKEDAEIKTDLYEYSTKTIGSSIEVSDAIESIKDCPIYLLNQDLIVTCVESNIGVA